MEKKERLERSLDHFERFLYSTNDLDFLSGTRVLEAFQSVECCI